MSSSFKPNPIVVDYQRDRHDGASRRGETTTRDDDHSGLFYLSVWAMSTGLFLAAFYLAAEVSHRDESAAAGRDKAAVSRRGLTMSQGRVLPITDGPALEANAGTRPKHGVGLAR